MDHIDHQTDKRLDELQFWIEDSLGISIESLVPASADASFRRYFRVTSQQKTFIVMDAPPDKESISEFIEIAQVLALLNVHAPAIIEQNQTQGFLLLEDLGDRTYLAELESNPQSLYNDALDALILIQSGTSQQPDFALKTYNQQRLMQEMDLFPAWYVQRHLAFELSAQNQQIWHDTTDLLINECLQQPQVWVHRDYHSRNLMITEQNSPGVIDFQDMVLGPISYDLASLFKDCYIEWPRAMQHQWLEQYLHKLSAASPDTDITLQQLIRWFDLTGLQRHLKVLGIFCRLHYRDGKDQYLSDLPLVEKYVLEVLEIYPELSNFKRVFEQLTQAKRT